MTSLRSANILGAAAGALVVPAVVLAIAALLGMVTATVGGLAGYRAIYYVAVFGLIVAGGTVVVTRREPLRFAFLALIVCFPVAYASVPPGRLGLTIFDVVMIALTLAFIGKNVFAPSKASEPLFPTTSLLIAWLLAIPCVVFSQFPQTSLQTFSENFAAYVFFLFALNELRRGGGIERLALLFSIVLIFMAGGLFVDHFLHLNLSLRGSNFNQLSYAAGLEISRAAGFFQDPQTAGAFLACIITFLLLLSVRGRFRGMRMRFVVWFAIAIGAVALVMTISRSAILACALVSLMTLFAFNQWNASTKLVIVGGATLMIAAIALTTTMETWLNIVPAAVAERFASTSAALDIRRMIWFDTWDMFADHPLTGIGFGSFQSYLIATHPGVFNYYGIGSQEGISYVPSQPENGYLSILYEGGIAGSIAALLVAGDALRRALHVVASARADSDARTECIAALAGLTSFGVTFLTLYTVHDERIAATLAFLLAVVWHRSLQEWKTPRTRPPRAS
jgi:O-antigen ligase